jgi:exonuclease SbcC
MTTIQHYCILLKQIKQEKQTLEATLTHYLQLLVYESELSQETHICAYKRTSLTASKEQILQEKGRLEQQQQNLIKLEQEYKEQETALKQIEIAINDYHAIAAATGKDGIQALLIEDTLPEIEQEANKLLAKLTDNQAHIIIESLRDLKKGGTRETLDINVSDTMGIRPYELFSGGEAFRIDFALRIAISRLLARRAGASLQTLIIDEGFGSQDEDGLGKIMDAIYKIQDDFAKIIIVSHLPIMKDQFPIHLVITKGPNGSVVTMIEQG